MTDVKQNPYRYAGKTPTELRDKVLLLTDNRVDIMLDDFTFKSFYQVLKEIQAYGIPLLM